MFNKIGSSRSNRAQQDNLSLDGAGDAPFGREIGAMLRERREAMGVSLAEVEAATRIRQKYLSAIESDDWQLLPGEIVGRGFLRNYAAYLELEPEEVLERRRSLTDSHVASTLRNTSAGAPLPPARIVDYRPKDVELRDDEDSNDGENGSRLPFLPILLAGVLLFFGWWNLERIGALVVNAYGGIQSGITQISTPREEPATPTTAPLLDNALVATFTPGSLAVNEAPNVAVAPVTDTPTPEPLPTEPPTPELLPTESPTPEPPTPEPPTPEPPTPTPEPPTPEPPTPIPVPTDPPAPVVVSAACPDPQAAIVSPGVNQVLAGVVQINGTATHENFDYYKLEYLAGGAYNYFDGANGPVAGGRLGLLDTTSLPNGAYTLRVVVVDNTGNFPAPCEVPVVIQN